MIANIFGGDGLIVIVIALVVLVGGSQLPKIARNVGLAGKEFRNAQAEAEQEQAARKAKEAADAAVALPQASAPAGAAAAAPAAPGVSAPTAGAPVAGSGSAEEGAITLTPAQLDALLKAREEQVRGESAGSN